MSARVWRSSSAKSTPWRRGISRPMKMLSRTLRFGAKRELLVDDRDAAVARLGRGGEGDGPAVEDDLPEVGWITPERIFISVDLPAPFSPKRVVTWPRWMSKFTPLSAWIAP